MSADANLSDLLDGTEHPVGRMAILWVELPDGTTEYSVQVDGRPEGRPRWAAEQLRTIADQLDAQGRWTRYDAGPADLAPVKRSPTGADKLREGPWSGGKG